MRVSKGQTGGEVRRVLPLVMILALSVFAHTSVQAQSQYSRVSSEGGHANQPIARPAAALATDSLPEITPSSDQSPSTVMQAFDHNLSQIIDLSRSNMAQNVTDLAQDVPNSPMPAPSAASPGPSPSEPVSADPKITQYRRLMELNGMAANIRLIIKNSKNAIRSTIIERNNLTSLSPQQELRFSTIADKILAGTEANLLDAVAAKQSKSLTSNDIEVLITANSSPAAAKYNAAKYADAEAVDKYILKYMNDAFANIMRTFKGSTES